MNFKDEIKNALKKNRPNLSDKSLATYTSTLSNFPKKHNLPNELTTFKKTNEILKALEDVTPNKRKSILGAIFILTNDEKIREHMLTDMKTVNENYKKQSMSKKEKDNWIDWDDVVKKYNDMETEHDHLFNKKTVTPKELNKMNELVLLASYVLMPPRRLMEIGTMKIRNFTKDDNHIKGNKIFFVNYKTASTYGKQVFATPTRYNALIKKWMNYNDTDFLIYHKKRTETSPSNLNKQLNSIFGKNISVDMLRHSFLTNYYSKGMPKLQDMEDLSKKMAHSVATALTYIKHEDKQ